MVETVSTFYGKPIRSQDLGWIHDYISGKKDFIPVDAWEYYTGESMKKKLTGQKHDQEKPRTDLLPTAPLLKIAEVLGFGAKKYDAHNWRGGIEYSRLLGAALRHLLAFNDGEDIDPESGLSHLAHLGCCVLFLLEQEAKGTGVDDRYKPRK